MLLIVTIVSGAIIGGVVAVVSQWQYLIYVFPILMAAAGGGLLGLVVRIGKVRSPMIAVLFGILIAVAMYGVYMYGHYYLKRQNAVNTAVSSGQVSSADEANTNIDENLQLKYGAPGFIGYLKSIVDNGIIIYDVSSTTSTASTNSTPIKGILVYLFWASELLIMVIGAAYYASVQARKPFCENCNSWYTGNARIGSVDRKSSKNLVQLLKNKQFAEAKAMFIPPTNPPRTDVEMNFCKTCQNSDVVVSAKRLVNTNRRRTSSSVLVKGVVTRQELTDLLPVATGNS